MNNLIRSEIYKLIRSRVFKNSCIIMSIVSFIAMFGLSNSGGDGGLKFFYCTAGGRDYGFAIRWVNDMIFIEYLQNALGVIVVVLFISIFIVGASVVNEYISGTIKNSIAYGHNRISIYISKVIGVSVIVMSITTVFILICILGSVIFYGLAEPVTLNRISEIVRNIILVNIVLTCIISINMCLTFMIKSKAVHGVLFIVIMFLTVISIVINISPAMRFNPFFMLMDICLKVPSIELMFSYTVNCLGLISVSTLVGVVFFKNEDIK